VSEEALSPKGRPPHVYCSNATEEDPAFRLAIFVEGTFANGIPFAGWLQSNGEDIVKKMNTFVDLLEGGTMYQSRKLPRQWIELKH
jgi:hypothetical protein